MTHDCVFCAIAAGDADESVVFEDDAVIVFTDLNPVTPGHVLVVPRAHAAGFEDLDPAIGGQVWSAGHDMAKALRRSGLPADGIKRMDVHARRDSGGARRARRARADGPCGALARSRLTSDKRHYDNLRDPVVRQARSAAWK